MLKPEVAQALRQAMGTVVESGTARRVHKAYVRSGGKSYAIGGKTGTGDHRFETYGPGGQVTSSRVVNRTATFAFYVGDRFFGVISAHVPGPDAAKFDFTSALAAELLKVLSPSLIPMIEQAGTALAPTDSIVPKPAPRLAGSQPPSTETEATSQGAATGPKTEPRRKKLTVLAPPI